MFRKITHATATNGLIIISTCVTIFHLLIIGGIIPYTIVWGGRLTNSAEMLRFESISIAINLLIIFVAVVEAGYLRFVNRGRLFTMLLWALFGLFIANTVANVFSVTLFERIVFTPLTALLALLMHRVITERVA